MQIQEMSGICFYSAAYSQQYANLRAGFINEIDLNVELNRKLNTFAAAASRANVILHWGPIDVE
jgi:hypothetical protein